VELVGLAIPGWPVDVNRSVHLRKKKLDRNIQNGRNILHGACANAVVPFSLFLDLPGR